MNIANSWQKSCIQLSIGWSQACGTRQYDVKAPEKIRMHVRFLWVLKKKLIQCYINDYIIIIGAQIIVFMFSQPPSRRFLLGVGWFSSDVLSADDSRKVTDRIRDGWCGLTKAATAGVRSSSAFSVSSSQKRLRCDHRIGFAGRHMSQAIDWMDGWERELMIFLDKIDFIVFYSCCNFSMISLLDITFDY